MKSTKINHIKIFLTNILIVLIVVTIGMIYVAIRVKPVTITYLGKDYRVKTLANTVKGVVVDKNIYIDESFQVAPSLDSYIRKGQNIIINKAGKVSKLEMDTSDINNIKIVKIEEIKETIKYKVKEKKNDKLLKGVRKVIREGREGSKTSIYKTIYDGNEAIKKSLISTDTKKSIDEIVEIGTKVDVSVSYNGGLSANETDLELLAKAIYAESRGEVYRGQVAVGAVIVNRVKSSRFPNSIRGVVYAPGQFCTVRDGQINLKPSNQAYSAAKEALNGVDPSNGALYFYNPRTSTSSWIYSRPVLATIGNHRFAK